jgi:GTP pyrophosphokinase
MPGTHRPPGYVLFFTPLTVAFTPNEFESVQFAYFVSKYGHALQTREGGGRYFDHPKAAAWIFIDELGGRDVRAIIDLLLHDISEDTYLLSSYRISRNFGKDIALDVSALTKLPKKKESTKAYLERVIARGPQAIVSKLCDRLHNLRTMEMSSSEKKERQIAETREYHCELLLPALRQCGEPWAGYASALETKITVAIDAFK